MLSAVADDALSKRLEALDADETGLLVGQATGDRDFLYWATPLAAQDDEEDDGPAAGGGAGQLALLQDTEWVVEHAAQVQRALPGGLAVMGVYTACSAETGKKLAPAVQGAVRALCEAKHMPTMRMGVPPRMLHLHMDRGKYVCKAFETAGDRKSSPVDFRSQKQLAGLHWFSTSIHIDLKVPLVVPDAGDAPEPGKVPKGTLRSLVARAMRRIVTDLRGAGWHVDGVPLQTDDIALGKNKTSKTQHQVDVFLPLGRADADAAGYGQSAKLTGALAFSGTVAALACANQKDTMQTAIEYLQADIVRSVFSRFELLWESLTDDHGLAPFGSRDAAYKAFEDSAGDSWKMPRRVLYNLADNLVTSDYIMLGEGPEDVADRAHALLGLPKTTDPAALAAMLHTVEQDARPASKAAPAARSSTPAAAPGGGDGAAAAPAQTQPGSTANLVLMAGLALVALVSAAYLALG